MKKGIKISISVVLILLLCVGGYFAYLYFSPLEFRVKDYSPNAAYSYSFKHNTTYDELVKCISEYNTFYGYDDNHKVFLGRDDKKITFMTFDKKGITVNFSALMNCADNGETIAEQLIYLNLLVPKSEVFVNQAEDYSLFIASCIKEDKNFAIFMKQFLDTMEIALEKNNSQ